MAADLSRFDAAQLRQYMINARRLGNEPEYQRAFTRLCIILPGTLDGNDADDLLKTRFWQAVHAAEQVRSEANGKTTKLSRTRQKVAKDGVVVTISSVVTKPVASEGFHILWDAGLPEFLFESIVIDLPDRFEAEVVTAAKRRLAGLAPSR